MALLVPNTGEVIALNYLTNKATPENLVLRLYTNNITPAETDTAATYTEATGFGYASIACPPVDWTVVAGAPSTATCTLKTFTFTGALGNVYGYYITRVTTGDLVYSERFTTGPFNIVNNGDTISITPVIGAD